MKELGPLLQRGLDSDMYRLMLAVFLFEKGDKRAVQKLRNVAFHSPLTSISVRFYQIKAAFDLGDIESVETDLAAIRMRLKRARNLNDASRNSLEGRLTRLKQLYQAKTTQALQELYQSVLRDPSGPDNGWLRKYLVRKLGL
jgi:hypothetical protein